MTDANVGEIRAFATDSLPSGWVHCTGQVLPIKQYQSLFHVIGTHFGGDGKTTFKLPDLRGRTPIGVSKDHPIGKSGGTESQVLTEETFPIHGHAVDVNADTATTPLAPGNFFAVSDGPSFRPDLTGAVPMGERMLGETGAGQGHPNMQPSLVLRYAMHIGSGEPEATEAQS